jgi:DNA helicase-2/ATP-dependent DNA helicase PcrA
MNAQDEALWVVRQVQTLQRERRCSAGDFAILCRVNAQSRPFEEAFMRARVPLRLVGTQRFYERKEIKDLVAYLKLLFNPNDDIAMNRVINIPARGIGAVTVEKLQILARQSDRSLFDTILDPATENELGRAVAAKIAPLRRVLEDLQADARDAQTVADLLSQVIDRIQYLEFLRREKTLESVDRLANVQELLRAAEDFDKTMREEKSIMVEGEADEYSQREESAPYLGLFLESSALDAGSDAGASGDAVTLMTLHSAKGLEFPIVFLVGMEQGLLPHARALWGEGAGGDELEEERRLCYVGLTRAREQIYLTYAAQRTLHGRTESTQASQFIDEIPRIFWSAAVWAAMAPAHFAPLQRGIRRRGAHPRAPTASRVLVVTAQRPPRHPKRIRVLRSTSATDCDILTSVKVWSSTHRLRAVAANGSKSLFFRVTSAKRNSSSPSRRWKKSLLKSVTIALTLGFAVSFTRAAAPMNCAPRRWAVAVRFLPQPIR